MRRRRTRRERHAGHAADHAALDVAEHRAAGVHGDLTPLTRPRRSSGVTSAAIVDRYTPEIMSAPPANANSTSTARRVGEAGDRDRHAPQRDARRSRPVPAAHPCGPSAGDRREECARRDRRQHAARRGSAPAEPCGQRGNRARGMPNTIASRSMPKMLMITGGRAERQPVATTTRTTRRSRRRSGGDGARRRRRRGEDVRRDVDEVRGREAEGADERRRRPPARPSSRTMP